jgi:phage shock protein E
MRFPLWIFIGFIVAAGVALFSMYRYSMDSPLRISAADARRRLQEGRVDIVVDVRTAAERNTIGAYPGSVHIPSADLRGRMPLQYPDRAVRVLLYCNTGQRARAAAEQLQGLGYTNVTYIAGPHTTLM